MTIHLMSIKRVTQDNCSDVSLLRLEMSRDITMILCVLTEARVAHRDHDRIFSEKLRREEDVTIYGGQSNFPRYERFS